MEDEFRGVPDVRGEGAHSAVGVAGDSGVKNLPVLGSNVAGLSLLAEGD